MTAPATDAVVLQGVRLDRGGRTILRDLDLRVPAGSITAVLGPSGTGKSTLLAAITGELVPAAGQVRVFDQPVPRGARALLEMRKRIGVLLQGNGLLTDLSVAENVALPLRAHTTLPEPLLQRLVAMKLNAVGLRAAADRPWRFWATGEQSVSTYRPAAPLRRRADPGLGSAPGHC